MAALAASPFYYRHIFFRVEEEIRGRVEAKIAERAEAKRAKNFQLADAIRAELDAMGVELRDTPEGTVWSAKADSLGR